MTTPLRLAALCALCLGCASAQKTDPEKTAAGRTATTEQGAAAAPAKTAADYRRELLAAMQREIEPLATAPVAAEDQRFKGVSEAAGKITLEEGEAMTTVNIPIGADSEITCFLYRDSIDAGVSIKRIIDALAGSVRVEALRPVDIVAAGERPAIFVELDYTTEAEGGRAAGQVKLMASPHDALPVVCLHDELGYRRSFQRITQGFAASLEPRGVTPRFAELQVFRIGELPVGFEHHRIWDNDKGQTLSENVAVRMIPKSRTEFTFHDTVSNSVGDDKDRLMSYEYGSAVNGELVTRSVLERQKGNSYSVKGMHEGKEFEATVKSKDKAGLLAPGGMDRAVKEKLLTGKQPELAFEWYHPTESTTGLTTIVYKKTPDTERSVAVVLGKTTFQAEVDAHGQLEKIEMPLGAGAPKLTSNRVMVQGAP